MKDIVHIVQTLCLVVISSGNTVAAHPNVEFQAARPVHHLAHSQRVLHSQLALGELHPNVCRRTQSPHILFLPRQKVALRFLCPRLLLQLCCKSPPAGMQRCRLNSALSSRLSVAISTFQYACAGACVQIGMCLCSLGPVRQCQTKRRTLSTHANLRTRVLSLEAASFSASQADAVYVRAQCTIAAVHLSRQMRRCMLWGLAGHRCTG